MYDVDQHGLDPKAFLPIDPKGNKVKITAAPPAVMLENPKFAHNLGQTIRACSSFGIGQLWWNGDRVVRELEGLDRIPREERMRGYDDVRVLYHPRPLDLFPEGTTPIAVEFRPGSSELLHDFEHPENPVYVFGPEDGSLAQVTLRHCHRFLFIQSKHCLNLSMAVGLILHDRQAKQIKKDRWF